MVRWRVAKTLSAQMWAVRELALKQATVSDPVSDRYQITCYGGAIDLLHFFCLPAEVCKGAGVGRRLHKDWVREGGQEHLLGYDFQRPAEAHPDDLPSNAFGARRPPSAEFDAHERVGLGIEEVDRIDIKGVEVVEQLAASGNVGGVWRTLTRFHLDKGGFFAAGDDEVGDQFVTLGLAIDPHGGLAVGLAIDDIEARGYKKGFGAVFTISGVYAAAGELAAALRTPQTLPDPNADEGANNQCEGERYEKLIRKLGCVRTSQ